MSRVAVTRVVCGLVVLACACRRKHDEPSYASDNVPKATSAEPSAPPSAATPSGTTANPLDEPVPVRADSPARLPDGGTLNKDPRGPRPAEWKTIVDGAMPALQACFDRANLPPGEIAVTMHYTVELPGYTGAVSAKGEAPKAVLDCCQSVVEELKFPQYRGTKVERDLAFTWSKRLTAPRAADGGGAAAESKK
jgi:hypothetical protein